MSIIQNGTDVRQNVQVTDQVLISQRASFFKFQ